MKIYKSSDKYAYQQQYIDILEESILPTPKVLTDKIPMSLG